MAAEPIHGWSTIPTGMKTPNKVGIVSLTASPRGQITETYNLVLGWGNSRFQVLKVTSYHLQAEQKGHYR